MGIKERRERERQELRQAILVAARELASQEGWQAVTIRKVAERIEYSPPTIYEHFASKEVILLEIMRDGFRTLLADMRRATDSLTDPQARIFGLARAYWEFAWRHPELYQVMHGLGGVPFCTDNAAIKAAGSPLAEADAVFDYTLTVLGSLAPQLKSIPCELESAVMILWATLHGLVALTMADRVPGGHERATELLERALNGFLAPFK
jgi:AcrR family transcriptional regulator